MFTWADVTPGVASLCRCLSFILCRCASCWCWSSSCLSRSCSCCCCCCLMYQSMYLGIQIILTMLHFECVVLRIDLGVVMESDSLSLFRGLEERTTSPRSQLNSRLGMASPVEMIKIIMISDNNKNHHGGPRALAGAGRTGVAACPPESSCAGPCLCS